MRFFLKNAHGMGSLVAETKAATNKFQIVLDRYFL